MRRLLIVSIALAALAPLLALGAPSPEEAALPAEGESAVRFAAVDLYIDPAGAPLGAYQLELNARAGVRIVGIEGGEHAAYAEPPYYDPEALRSERVILADYSLADDLPRGRFRVARVHVMIEGPGAPEYDATLAVATDRDGDDAGATLTWKERTE